MNEAYKTVLEDGLKIDTNKDNILEQDDDYVLPLRRFKEVDKKYDVVGQREKWKAPKKRKRKGNVRELVDDSDIEEIHPHYELVLRHLKEGGKFEFEKNCLPLAMKYESDMGDNGADGKEQHFYPKHRRRNRCVAENLCERVYPAQAGERNKVRSRRKLKEVAGCAAVVKGDHECFERAEVQFHKECFYHPPSSGGARISELSEQLYHQLDPGSYRLGNDGAKYGGEASSGDKNKTHYARKKTRVVTRMNLVRKDKQTDRINVVKKEKSYLYGAGIQREIKKEWPLEHANKAQSGKTEKVQGQRHLQQLNRGKKAVGQDGAEERKTVVLLDNDRFHNKRIQEKILPIKYGCKHAAQAQPVKKCKEQIGGKLKGVVKKEVKKENEKIYQDSSSRTNRVTRSQTQLAGQVQLGKERKVCGQTEFLKVVRGDSGISSKKTAFVTVKKEPDHFVETDLHIKGTHSQIRYVNCAEIVPAEVEILDSDIFIKKRILSPFVPSQLHYSVRLFLAELHPSSLSLCFCLSCCNWYSSKVMLHDM